jgi:hypothetical protein
MGIKRNIHWFLLAWMSLASLHLRAQPDVHTRSTKIVLFVPLQLDSIFTKEQEYRLGRYEFPRAAGGYLEFYQGMVAALDSLKSKPGQIDLTVVDTKGKENDLRAMLEKDTLRSANLWLMFGNVADSRLLASYAHTYEIPLININLPNDAGIEDNPHYFMWNSTLATQCEAIYKHLQQHYPLHRIVLVRKKGSMEDRIQDYLNQYAKKTPGIPITYTTLGVSDTISQEFLQANLDSARETILVGASLDERFARTLATTASQLCTNGYKIELLGMSTWENVKEFAGNRYRNLELTIPTPFYFAKTDELSKWLQTRFQTENFGKISDLYLRGYELAFLLHPMLLTEEVDLQTLLPGKRKLLFSEIDWQAVRNPQTGKTDYLENKKIYFVKRLEGVLRSVR